jgi:hypothetical protein
MCIIVVKPAGVAFPTDAIMQNCWSGNRDGFGAMWRDAEGKVNIDKGYMTERDMLRWKHENETKLQPFDVVMHFRFGTHGTNTPGNTHPFPITNVVAELRATNIQCTRAIAHNGVLAEFGKTGSSLSDTMVFVKHLAGMTIQSFVGSVVSKQYGKFVYMNSADTIMFGDFTMSDDLFYSNDGYKTPKYRGTYYNGCQQETVQKRLMPGMVGCSGDCTVCTKKDTCVWTRECNFRCFECELEKCAFDIPIEEYNRWRAAEMQERIDQEAYDAAIESMKGIP